MDFGALRDLTLDLNLQVHGVPATVTRPAPFDTTPIETRIIWRSNQTEALPGGFDLQRAEPRRVAVLSRSEVPAVPRMTRIEAPEKMGGTAVAWQVDATDREEADVVHVYVIPALS